MVTIIVHATSRAPNGLRNAVKDRFCTEGYERDRIGNWIGYAGIDKNIVV